MNCDIVGGRGARSAEKDAAARKRPGSSPGAAVGRQCQTRREGQGSPKRESSTHHFLLLPYPSSFFLLSSFVVERQAKSTKPKSFSKITDSK